MKKFLKHFDNQELKTDLSAKIISSCTPSKQSGNANCQDTFMDCLRTQMLITAFEKLPKFSGKSKQNVFNWLQEIQKTMNIFKLTDNEKLLYISLCLEGVAKDWFFDYVDSFLTWASFLEKFIKIFKLPRYTDNLFDPLCLFENYIKQNTKQCCFEFMNLHKEENNITPQAIPLIEKNRFTFHSPTDKQYIATSTNINSEDTSMFLGSIKSDLDQPVSQQLSEVNPIAFETKEETLNSEDERERSTIQTQKVDLAPMYDESFNVLSLEKLTPDDINIVSDGRDVFKNFGITTYNSIIATDTVFNVIQYSLNMHNEPIITEIRRQANITTTTQMILLKIKIAFDQFEHFPEYLIHFFIFIFTSYEILYLFI
ncbi:unnamed protein product [Rotaria sp. Silwood2]|nr:unnamed protein product [Rotaria sp. Silwood2]